MACDSPIYMKINGYLEDIPVGCGKCPSCKINRVNDWVFRLQQEEKRSFSSYFITLTYNNLHCPITPNGFMTLVKKDFQDFMKRLRYNSKQKNLKYYCAGEYGEMNRRPHYHFILFNLLDVEEVTPDLFRSKVLEKSWSKLDPISQGIVDEYNGRGVLGEDEMKEYLKFSSNVTPIGDIHIGRVTSASIAYTAKYIDKGFTVPAHARDDRQREFSLMSKRMGDNYLTDAVKKYYLDDLTRNYVTREGGFRGRMPKYYRDKLFGKKVDSMSSFGVDMSKVRMLKDGSEVDSITGEVLSPNNLRFRSIAAITQRMRLVDRLKRLRFAASNPDKDFDMVERGKVTARYNRFYSNNKKIRSL